MAKARVGPLEGMCDCPLVEILEDPITERTIGFRCPRCMARLDTALAAGSHPEGPKKRDRRPPEEAADRE